MEALRKFPDIGSSEEVTRSFNFAPGLAVGETLVALSATCEIDVLVGSDSDAASRLIAGPNITGTIVSVLIGSMVDGVSYRVRVNVTTSAPQHLSLWAIQKCVGP